MSRIRRNLTFANVCSFIALTVALGTGGAYAANTVFSTDIVDGEVKNADLAPGSVGNSKILTGSVTSSKTLDNSLSGADINESTLGKTPAATNADKLAGVAAKPIVRLVAPAPEGGDACAGEVPETARFCASQVSYDHDGNPGGWAYWWNVGGESQPAAFYKDAFGIVHVEGFVKAGYAAGDRTIFILPPGYRPSRARAFAAIGKDYAVARRTIASIDVTTTGEVVVTKHPGSEAGGDIEFLSLDGIAFRTG